MNIPTKIVFYFTLIITFLFSMIGVNLKSQSTVPQLDDYELVWSDEFSGSSLNLSNWKTENAPRRGGFWDGSQVSVSDGKLHIRTQYRTYGNQGTGFYSGAIQSVKQWKRGYFEIKCIQPAAAGIWSAFWLTCDGTNDVTDGGRNGAEIDVFESPYYGSPVSGGMVQSSVFYDGYGLEQKSEVAAMPVVTRLPNKSIYSTYHIYSCLWTQDEYIFYIDGKETGRSTNDNISTVAENLIVSTEIGGANGVPASGWFLSGTLTDKTVNADYIVDYVRVYQHK